MAEGEGRGGRLSGMIPLVVVGVIVVLFFRSCFQGIDSLPFIGGDDNSDSNGGSEAIQETPTEPADDSDSEDGADHALMMEPRDPECPPEDGSEERHLQWTEAPPMCIDTERSYTATLETDRGDIVISLDSENAPNTVNNFVFLARWGFYDGSEFYGVIPGVNVQTGDPIGRPPGTGGPGYTFDDELPTEEPYYPLFTVAMSNAGPNTNASEFFIVTGSETQIPPDYSRFGYVTRGQTVVEEIDATGVRRAGTDRSPRERTLIEHVTIEER